MCIVGVVHKVVMAAGLCAAVGCAAHRGSHVDGGASDAALGGAMQDAARADATEGAGLDAAVTATDEDAALPVDGGAQQAQDAESPRAFQLATTGAQLLVQGPVRGLSLTPGNVVDDSEVIAVHQEFYGVPWEAFLAAEDPPPEFDALMQSWASLSRAAQKPIFLSVSMLNGSRESLAAKTVVEQGAVKSEDDWSVKCYDFAKAADGAEMRDAYVRYVTYMVETLAPTHLNVAIEVNLFFEKCPAASAGVVDVINAVYAAVKAKAKDTLVFPSFQIDHLYGYSEDSCPAGSDKEACFDALYAPLAGIARDRFAMSSYPYMAGILDPGDLPQDWFARGAARGGETPLIAETGWPSTPIVVRAQDGTCPMYFAFDEPTSATYLKRVLADADAHGLSLVTWWSDRDLVTSELMTDCPCTFDATWCAVLDIFRGPAPALPGGVDTQLFGELLLKVFGTMGLRSYDGTPKRESMRAWDAVRARPYQAR